MADHSPNKLLAVPSLLGGDHADLAGSARKIAASGAQWAHLDIMDGHFVDNLTFGPGTLSSLRRHVPDLYYDVHLMLDEPARYVDAFAEAGANSISIHIEPWYDHEALLRHIRSLGVCCGIAFNPATEWEKVQHLLYLVDLVLVMTVHPGRGGQPFRDDVPPKIKALADWRARKGLGYRIEVDGGIDVHHGHICRDEGADTFVAGTSFFKAADPAAFVKALEG